MRATNRIDAGFKRRVFMASASAAAQQPAAGQHKDAQAKSDNDKNSECPVMSDNFCGC